MMTLMSKAIVMIAFVLAPTQMMMMGPSATFGRELSMVRNGSIVSAKNLNRYIATLMTKAITVPKENEMNISKMVVHA